MTTLSHIKVSITFILMFVFSILSLLFENTFVGIPYFLFGIIVGLLSLFLNRFGNKILFVIELLIYSIPLSFRSVFNQSYGLLPISWFNLLLLILVIYTLFLVFESKKLAISSITLIALFFLIIFLIPLMNSAFFYDGLKQYLNIASCFGLFLIAPILKKHLSTTDIDMIVHYYLMSSVIMALTLIMQVILYYGLDIQLGLLQRLGTNRVAFGSLFNDYSFLSLFLVSGAMFLYANRTKYNDNFLVGFLLISSMLTSARTGVAAFLVVYSFKSFIDFLKLYQERSRKLLVYISVYIIIILIIFYGMKMFRPGDILSDSGRSGLNVLGIDLFLSNPIFGNGFGTKSISLIIGGLPHNLVVQFLSQTGVYITTILILFITLLSIKLYKYKRNIFWTFLTIMIGALFIPDIFNSRFLSILFLIIGVNFV